MKSSDWMKELWGKIVFAPETFELVDEDDKSKAIILDKERFPWLEANPKPKETDQDRYWGITVRNLPVALSDKEVLEFLVKSGAPEDATNTKVNTIRSTKNTSATVEGIDPQTVIKMIEAIDFPQSRTKFFNVPLYCRPLRIQSPVKAKETATPSISSSTPKSPLPKPTPKVTNKPQKVSPTHIIGGVLFKDITEQVGNDDDGTANLKRNALNRSPLDGLRDPKLVKK